MKNIIFIFIFLWMFLPQPVSAHTGGLPVYFKINEKFAVATSLQAAAIGKPNFPIPQDVAPEQYVKDQPTSFIVDRAMLSQALPPEILDNIKFYIDFGDKSTSEGEKVSHTYTTIGSYIVTVHMKLYDNKGNLLTQYSDPYLLHVVPDKTYKDFPDAIIKVNGTRVGDPLYGRADADFNQDILFDASDSKTSSKIVDYRWNFGDGTSSNKSSVVHTFKNQSYETVVLRVTDKNGFNSYAFLGLKNVQHSKKPGEKNLLLPSLLTISSILFAVVSVILTIFLSRSVKTR